MGTLSVETQRVLLGLDVAIWLAALAAVALFSLAVRAWRE